MKKSIIKTILFLIFYNNIYSQTISTIAGDGTSGNSGDGGPATTAKLFSPRSIAIDNSGNLYISDYINLNVRKVSSAGIITRIAGTGTAGYSGDGGNATAAELNNPASVATDRSGNIYICDLINNRVRKVTSSGIISTVAGNGYGAPTSGGYFGDGGPATNAQLWHPAGVVLDTLGNMYISDISNYRIRKVNSAGIITTIAGIGVAGFSGDGGAATTAQINANGEIAVDKYRSIYFCDIGSHRIRKIDTLGTINSIAGNGSTGFSGDNGPATLASIGNSLGIDVSINGDIYITGGTNNRIMKINTAGIITSFSGNGTGGYSGDGGPAISAKLNAPYGIAVDNGGNVYLADIGNKRIRKISSTVFVSPVYIVQQSINLYPNPATDHLTIDNPDNGYNSYIIYTLLGQAVLSGSLASGKQDIAVRNLASGTYCISFISESSMGVNRFFVKQ